MSKKIDDYKMKVKKLEKTVILIGVLILLLGVLISIAYYTVNRGKLNKSPLSQVETIANGDNTETKTFDNEEVLNNPGKGLVLRLPSNKECEEITSILYYRFKWCDIEKNEDVFSWDIIDKMNRRCNKKRKKNSFWDSKCKFFEPGCKICHSRVGIYKWSEVL